MRPYGLVAIVCFGVAATAGAILRFGLAYGLPDWVTNFSAWRHAHSHLMYFGWGTLGLMAMIWHTIPRYSQRALPRGVHAQMILSTIAALASFPAFLPNGYGSTAIGTLNLPLGSIVSGVNGMLWLLFAALYWQATRRLAVRPLPVRLWDWAIVLLLLAWSGALGLVLTIVLDVPGVGLQLILLHVFLELIAVGWFTLGLLGLLWAHLDARGADLPNLPVFALAFALAPTFFLGVAPAVVPPTIFWISALANLAAGIMLAQHLVALWRRWAQLPVLARFGMAFLAAQVLIAVLLVWPGLWQWAAGTQLRIFVLHSLLLGWLSSGLLAVLGDPLQAHGKTDWRSWLWMAGVIGLVGTLFLIGLAGIFQPVPVSMLLTIAAWSTLPLLLGGVLHALQGLGMKFRLSRSPHATLPARSPDIPR